MITPAMHEKFQKWHMDEFNFSASSRSHEPGCINTYEHPFTNGAWSAWVRLNYGIRLGRNTLSDSMKNNK